MSHIRFCRSTLTRDKIAGVTWHISVCQSPQFFSHDSCLYSSNGGASSIWQSPWCSRGVYSKLPYYHKESYFKLLHFAYPPIRELSHPTIIVIKQHSFQSIWLRRLILIFYANVLTTLSRFQLLHMDLELEPPPNLGNEYPNLAHI